MGKIQIPLEKLQELQPQIINEIEGRTEGTVISYHWDIESENVYFRVTYKDNFIVPTYKIIYFDFEKKYIQYCSQLKSFNCVIDEIFKG